METKIYTDDSIKEAAQQIQAGELIAFPTETVYGLGADATNEGAVKQVYQVKGRPSDNPLIVHVSDPEMVKDFVDNFPEVANPLIEHFWPGPLTLIFSVKEGVLPNVVTGGLSTAAFRMPNNEKTLRLIRAAGVPIVGPSANTSGKPSPTTAQHVYHDLSGKIKGVLDDGPTPIGVESTVLDLSDPEAGPVILRPGGVTLESLQAVIGPVTLDRHLVTESEAPKAPGMKYKHYAPNAPVYMIREVADWDQAVAWGMANGKKIGLLADQSILTRFAKETIGYPLTSNHEVAEATRNLFAGLRALDEAKVDLIFVETFPEDGLGMAYMNRLNKAAGQKYFEK